jgi:hypothetical protein
MHRAPRILFVGVAVALAVLTAVPSAAARDHADERGRDRRLHSFEGSCSLVGTVTFSPGATFVQQVLTLESHLEGTCDGTLDGQPVSDAPVQMHNAGQSSGSCAHAETLGPGPGTLTFVDGPTIHYTFEFNWVGTDGVTRYEGRRSGLAVSHGTFRNPGLSGEGSKCATTGVTETGITINLATQSPLVSGCKAQHGRTRCR